MLRIADLRLDYDEFHARYSLALDEGRMCAVVGPSGGGKTTLLHAIAGFETPRSGELAFAGVDLLPLPPGARPVAMVFQDNNLFPHLSARDNAALAMRPSLRLTADETAKLAGAFAQVGLSGLENRRPSELSGGQRQRVALARALVSDKPLLLLDEPFGGLDPGLRRDMIALVDGLRSRRGLTVLMTIHTPDDVVDVADHAAFVADGEVIAYGAPRDVLIHGRDPRIDAFLGAPRA